MRLAVLIVGLVILLVGGIGALYGWVTVSGAETSYLFFCTTGVMPKSFCDNLNATMSAYRTVALVGSVIAVVGLVVLVIGAVMKGPPAAAPPMMAPQPAPPPVPSPAGRTCARCGRMNPVGDRFCANCGAPL